MVSYAVEILWFHLPPNQEEVSFKRKACFVVGLSSVTGENAGGWK